MKVLFTEPQVQYPNKIQRNGVRAEVGIRLNYALLAGYLRDNSDTEIRIQPYRFYDFIDKSYSLEEDIADADIICVGASTAEAKSTRKIFEEAKRQGKITVAGGIFPTANQDYLQADYTVVGEGEQTLLELVQALERGQDPNVLGLSTTKRRPAIKNIDAINPAYDLLPMGLYRDHVKGLVYSSRGCVNACDFCTVSPHWNRMQRHRSIESVIEELEMYKDLGFNIVNFKDESLTTDKERLFTLAKEVKGMDLRFKAKARLRDLDEETLSIMYEAGFREIHTGVESLTQSFEKGVSREEVVRRINLCLDLGFIVNPSFILGLPGQTPEDLEEDAQFIMDVGSNPRIKVYTCMYTTHPSSGIWDSDKVTIISDDFDDYTHLRLVALPKSLGESYSALRLLYKTQKKVVRAVSGMELPLDIEKILRINPKLRDVRC
jgi:anaerobic magnesium-protoporphyrin IX monomethyl ester cyclase